MDMDTLVAKRGTAEAEMGHRQRKEILVGLHNVNAANRFVFYQLPDCSAVACADYQNATHVRMDRHRHMGEHFMVDEFVFLGQKQLAVKHENSPVFDCVENFDCFIFTFLRSNLAKDLHREAAILRMLVGIPQFHLISPH